MKGRNHIRMGACTVALVGAVGLLPVVDAPVVVVAGVGLFMFGKVAPDLDHPTSSITRSWGWLSRGFSILLVRPSARWVYDLTRSRHDPMRASVHRGFTHTLPGAAVIGIVTAWTLMSGPWFATICLALMFGGAARVYDRDWLGYAAIAGAAVGWFAWPELVIAAPWLAFALALGCYAHAVDDCVTTAGAPLRFPLADERGRRWARVGPPEWMRFDTGSGYETAFVWAAVIATSGFVYWVWLAPLVGPFLLEHFTDGVG